MQAFCGNRLRILAADYTRKLQEVVVDRLELMGKRIDPRDGEAEVRVVLVGQPQPRGFDTKTASLGVAIEWRGYTAVRALSVLRDNAIIDARAQRHEASR